jgi:hypothetical protein
MVESALTGCRFETEQMCQALQKADLAENILLDLCDFLRGQAL